MRLLLCSWKSHNVRNKAFFSRQGCGDHMGVSQTSETKGNACLPETACEQESSLLHSNILQNLILADPGCYTRSCVRRLHRYLPHMVLCSGYHSFRLYTMYVNSQRNQVEPRIGHCSHVGKGQIPANGTFECSRFSVRTTMFGCLFVQVIFFFQEKQYVFQ